MGRGVGDGGEDLGRDFEHVHGANVGAHVAQAGEGIPHEGVQLQGLDVVVDGLPRVAMGGPQLTQQAEAGSSVRDVPPRRVRVFV